MPRVLQINVCFNVYSTGRIVSELSAYVHREGWQTFAAFRAGTFIDDHITELVPIGGGTDKYLHFIKSFCFDAHGLGSRDATKTLLNDIKKISPDIIHIHNLHGYYLNYELLFRYLNQLRIPVIITAHDCWTFTGHCAHFVTAGCYKWESVCNHCQLKSKYPKSLIDRSKNNFYRKKSLFLENNNIHIVAVSEWLGKMISRSFLRDKRMSVINNGVDVQLFRPLAFTPEMGMIPRNKKVILAVSSVWYKDKGFDDYFHLAEKLPEDMVICMVGLSKKQMSRLPSNIIGISRTANVEEMVRVYNRADVVLSLSYAESFGLSIAEAMACGTPAVVYDNTALPELISPGTGRVVRTGDVDGVVNAVVDLLSKDEQETSRMCRERAVQQYNKEDTYKKYFQLYLDLMERA